MFVFGENILGGRGEVRIGESTMGNGDHARPEGRLPEHRAATGRTEVLDHGLAAAPQPRVVRHIAGNHYIGLPKKGGYTIGAARASLALKAMAKGNLRRLAFAGNVQLAASAPCNTFWHRALPFTLSIQWDRKSLAGKTKIRYVSRTVTYGTDFEGEFYGVRYTSGRR